jgi:O-antigen/teichoic acid export membrane protein
MAKKTPTPDKEKRQGTLRAVGPTAINKVLVMGLSGVLGLITSRLIIQNFGTDAYVQYGLLTTMPALLPFADLGIAAVVINAIAGSADPKNDPMVKRTITTALRILSISALTIVTVAITITVIGWWPAILGNGLISDGGPLVAGICLAIFGLALPLTIGQRILVGLRRNALQVATQTVVAPFMFLSIGALVLFAVPAGTELSIFSYIASALVSVICILIAARLLTPQVRSAIKEVPFRRRHPGVPAIGLAWPMLVQMIALPVAMQTDRLLLSHLTVGDELAQYNLASQLFGLVLQVIVAAGITLWPIYAKARSQSRVESPRRATLIFMGSGLLLAGLLALLSPYLAHFISNGAIVLDPWLVGGFVVFVGLQATKYPIGMYMTDKRGLTFQVLPILLMVPLNLGLSWWLIGIVGAGGPIIGSAISVLLCQVIPNLWYVSRDLKRRRQDTSINEDILVRSEIDSAGEL